MNNSSIRWIYLIIGLSSLLCIGSFVVTFYHHSISTTTESWGQLGDYVGGLMNPLIAILNVYVTIQIARAVNNFALQQTHHQVNAQKELVKTQMLYEILQNFRKDILLASNGIESSLKENNHAQFDSFLRDAHAVMDGFIKYHQDLFSFPPGIALSIVTEHNKWLAIRSQGHWDINQRREAAAKNRIEIDLMLALLYGSIIEEAKQPEPKPLTEEIFAKWEEKLGLKKPKA